MSGDIEIVYIIAQIAYAVAILFLLARVFILEIMIRKIKKKVD